MSREDDFSTSEVIDWIRFTGNQVLRINENDEILIQEFDVTSEGRINMVMEVKGKTYSLDEFSSFWYRRGRLNIYSHKVHEKGYRNKPLSDKQKASNTKKSKIRARVEHVFGFTCLSADRWNKV